jgi:hypothetical protein
LRRDGPIDPAEERAIARHPLTQQLNRELIECFRRNADKFTRRAPENPIEGPAQRAPHPPTQ